jgi:hypothetical protein
VLRPIPNSAAARVTHPLFNESARQITSRSISSNFLTSPSAVKILTRDSSTIGERIRWTLFDIPLLEQGLTDTSSPEVLDVLTWVYCKVLPMRTVTAQGSMFTLVRSAGASSFSRVARHAVARVCSTVSRMT